MKHRFATTCVLAGAALLSAAGARAEIEASLAFNQPTGTVLSNQAIEVWLTLSPSGTSDPLTFNSSVQPFDTSGLPSPLPTQGTRFDLPTNTEVTADFDVIDRAFMGTAYGCSGTFTNACIPAAYQFVFHVDDSNPARPSINYRSAFTLQAGESFSFLFGTFLPVGTAAAPGTYTFYNAFVTTSLTGRDELGNTLTAFDVLSVATCPEGVATCAQPFTRTVTAVPEPATWGLLGLGLAGVGAIARRRRQA